LIGPDDLTVPIRAAAIATGDSDAVDVISMRDILWLAAAMAAQEAPDREQLSDVIVDRTARAEREAYPQPDADGIPQAIPSATQPESAPQPSAELFDTGGQISEGLAGAVPARPIDLVGPAALGQRLELARALRPFRRTIPSRHRHVLDVEATIRASAASRRTSPILRPPRNDGFPQISCSTPRHRCESGTRPSTSSPGSSGTPGHSAK
jgi:hypothetical protein